MTDQSEPSATERAKRICNHHCYGHPGCPSGNFQSECSLCIADELTAHADAARRTFALKVIAELRALADRLEETLPDE